MVNLPVCARPLLLAVAVAAAPPASAEVNLMIGPGLRDWEPNTATANCGGGISALYQVDFGPAEWDWRPELAVATGFELFDDCSQLEVGLGLARRWRWDDVELRASAGAVSMETRDSLRESQVGGAYLQLAALWRIGERFALGLGARRTEVDDAVVGGVDLPSDATQFAFLLAWRFGD